MSWKYASHLTWQLHTEGMCEVSQYNSQSFHKVIIIICIYQREKLQLKKGNFFKVAQYICAQKETQMQISNMMLKFQMMWKAVVFHSMQEFSSKC